MEKELKEKFEEIYDRNECNKRSEIIDAIEEAYQLGEKSKQDKVERLVKGIEDLIKRLDKSALRYKACFGEENPGGEQIYQYHAKLLRDILNPKP